MASRVNKYLRTYLDYFNFCYYSKDESFFNNPNVKSLPFCLCKPLVWFNSCPLIYLPICIPTWDKQLDLKSPLHHSSCSLT